MARADAPSPVVEGDAPPLRALDLPELGSSAGSSFEAAESDGTVDARGHTVDLDDLLARARNEGRAEGLEQGRAEASKRVTQAIDSMKGLVASIEAAAAARDQEARGRVVVLATAIAAHLLEREVRAAPELVSELVRRAIAEFPVRDTLRVHMNPTDLALLSSGFGQDPGREHLTSGQYVRWVPDPEIRPGGCVVEGSERIVVARVSTTVERIVRALSDV